MKVLRAVRMERCIGCHSCSLACARLVYKQFSWNTAGIRIKSVGGVTSGFKAEHCLACDPAPCAEACPTGALRPRKSGGGVMLKSSLCIRCGKCAEVCPVDAVYLGRDQRPHVCIHCGRCVAYCPHDCLELVDVDKAPAPDLEVSHASA